MAGIVRPMNNERYLEEKSLLMGKYFLVDESNKPRVLLQNDTTYLPVFSGPEPIADAERSFRIPQGRVLQITDSKRFCKAFPGYPIILDPHMKDGQFIYDKFDLDPKEIP